jgi:rod shape determining protein RodA
MREWLRTVNWPVAASALGLFLIGLASLSSLSPDDDGPDVTRGAMSKQFIFGAAGVGLMLGLSMVHFSRLRRSAVFWYVAGIAGLVALLVLARPVRGVRAWFSFGGLTIQPAEFAKIAVVVMLARYAAGRTEWTAGQVTKFLAIAALPVALVLKQPDLGMATVIAFSAFVVMLASEIRIKVIAALVGVVVLAAPLAYQFVLKEYQRQRILAVFSPEKAEVGKRDQQEQAMRLMGSGTTLGRGLGQATTAGPYYLPERHNDFILTVVGEEMGFLGVVLVLALFGLILLQCVRAAERTREPFARLCVIGLGAQLFVQVVSNVGMNLGLLPVTGLTLPFVSYGGSSLVANFLLAGVIMSVATHWVPSFSSKEMPASSYSLALPGIR